MKRTIAVVLISMLAVPLEGTAQAVTPTSTNEQGVSAFFQNARKALTDAGNACAAHENGKDAIIGSAAVDCSQNVRTAEDDLSFGKVSFENSEWTPAVQKKWFIHHKTFYTAI